MLAVAEVARAPFDLLGYLGATNTGPQWHVLPMLRGTVEGLPQGVAGLVLAGDLQGVVPGDSQHEERLLGVALADRIAGLCEAHTLPPASSLGMVLTGDLYSAPGAAMRGATGGVGHVWRALADRFAWVAGVAGNHDETDTVPGARNVSLLDGTSVIRDGLRLGGVGLISGKSDKFGRRAQAQQLDLIAKVLRKPIDLMILHEGPAGGNRQPGNAAIAAALERHGATLTVFGHMHWPEPVASSGQCQYVNVDARVLILTR